MEKQTIKDLKKGEFFTRKPIENPKESQVWIRGEYDKSAKAYEATRFDDINHSVLLGRTTGVYTDFTF